MRTNPYWLTVPGDRMLDAMHLAERLYLKAYTLVVQAPQSQAAQVRKAFTNYQNLLTSYDGERLGYGLRSVWGPGRVRLDVATELIMSQAEHLLLVDKARSIARELTELQMGEGDKVRAVTEYLGRNMRYVRTDQLKDHNPFFGIFRNEGVCQSIALQACYLLRAMGVAARYISGRGRGRPQAPGHAWNLVRVDGAWYHLDCTELLDAVKLQRLFCRGRLLFNPLESYERRRQSYAWDETAYDPRMCDLVARYRDSFAIRRIELGEGPNLKVDQMALRVEQPVCLPGPGQPGVQLDLLAQLLGCTLRRRGEALVWGAPGGEVALHPARQGVARREGGCYYAPLPLAQALARASQPGRPVTLSVGA